MNGARAQEHTIVYAEDTYIQLNRCKGVLAFLMRYILDNDGVARYI